jgi:hypothetical protein
MELGHDVRASRAWRTSARWTSRTSPATAPACTSGNMSNTCPGDTSRKSSPRSRQAHIACLNNRTGMPRHRSQTVRIFRHFHRSSQSRKLCPGTTDGMSRRSHRTAHRTHMRRYLRCSTTGLRTHRPGMTHPLRMLRSCPRTCRFRIVFPRNPACTRDRRPSPVRAPARDGSHYRRLQLSILRESPGPLLGRRVPQEAWKPRRSPSRVVDLPNNDTPRCWHNTRVDQPCCNHRCSVLPYTRTQSSSLVSKRRRNVESPSPESQQSSSNPSLRICRAPTQRDDQSCRHGHEQRHRVHRRSPMSLLQFVHQHRHVGWQSIRLMHRCKGDSR